MQVMQSCKSAQCLYPIDDLADRASQKNYSEAECVLRKKLAAAYRLVDIYGWSEGIYNHITCRLPGNDDRFLINPFGLLFHEITASSLITVLSDGTISDPGSTRFGINNRGYTLHSAIHQARRDVQCILHMHTEEAIAVSCLQGGFMPVCQEGLAIGPVAIHDFHGVLVDLDERRQIVESLGEANALVLRNHGFLTCGLSIEDAFLKAYFFLYNVRAQLKIAHVPNLVLPSAQAAIRTYETLKYGEKSGQNKLDDGSSKGSSAVQWGPGGLDWEAHMRLLDDMGLKTGHQYRLPVWRQ